MFYSVHREQYSASIELRNTWQPPPTPGENRQPRTLREDRLPYLPLFGTRKTVPASDDNAYVGRTRTSLQKLSLLNRDDSFPQNHVPQGHYRAAKSYRYGNSSGYKPLHLHSKFL